MNKKIFLILLAALLVFAFTSCDSNVESSDETSDAETPLTLENAGSSDATINVIIVGYSSNDVNLKYSIDGGSATDITSTETAGTDITLPAGSTISFYGDRTGTGSASKHIEIDCNADCYVYGNVMSLLDSDGFGTLTTVDAYAFYYLFFGASHINNHDSKSLVLPATTLANSCYYCMFYNCTGLRTAPELPATELAEGCYQSMFLGCTGITTAPTLSATTLKDSCYYSMFNGCTSLTTAPELPATTLVDNCYYNMFNGCSALSSITCLATDISATNCTFGWVSGVATSGTFKRPSSASSLWSTGTSGIPSSFWTEVDYPN